MLNSIIEGCLLKTIGIILTTFNIIKGELYIKLNMMKKLLLCLALFMIGVAASATEVKKLTSEIAIDGHLDEDFWEINIPLNNLYGSDNTGTFGLLWDDEYFYVGVVVTDPLLVKERRQSFFEDGVEICIDGNHDRSRPFDDDNDLMFVKPISSFWIQEKNMKVEGVIHKYKTTEDGYTMEFAIPWTLMNTTPAAGKTMGFNLLVNDDDLPGDFWHFPKKLSYYGYNSDGWEYYKYPTLWGSIQLSSDEASFGQPSMHLVYPNDGPFLISGKPVTIQWVASQASQVTIEYSTDQGNSWTTLADGINAASGTYSWTPTVALDNAILRISDANDATIYDQSDEYFVVSAPLTATKNLITSSWENFKWPYYAYYPDNQSNNQVQNSCGPSSLARIIREFEFPRQGSGAHEYTDITNATWSADFGNTIYRYDRMPLVLAGDAPEQQYEEVATLMLHTAVAMNDTAIDGTNLENMSRAMSTHFNYKESQVEYMYNYTNAEWTQILMNEIDNGRTVLVEAMTLEAPGWHTSNSVAGHWYHCDGYNEDGEFHAVLGFGNYQYDGYYPIEAFTNYAYNIGILTGLEPDTGNKSLALTSLNGNETFSPDDVVDISWNSENVASLVIEYSTDSGWNWTELATVDAAAGNWAWTLPQEQSAEYMVRITDQADINVYDKSDQVFAVGQQTTTQVTFVVASLPDYTPAGDQIFIVGNFNAWNPGNAQYALSKNDDNRWEITLDGFEDGETIEFKFTRGDWGTVEVGAQGEEISNRTFTFNGDQTVQVTIHHWTDGDPGGGDDPADPIIPPYSHGFDDNSFGQIGLLNVAGAQEWQTANYGTPAPCAMISGYSGSANVANQDWMILPGFDFSSVSNQVLQFDEAINYGNAVNTQQTVLISTDYSGSGDPNQATWTTLPVANRASGSSWTFVTVDPVDLNSYSGQEKVYIAFSYTSTTSGAATWEIDNISITTQAAPNQLPQIESVSTNPSSPTPNDAFHVSATVTDSDGTIASVVLNWGLTSDNLNNPISMTNGSGDEYTTSSAIAAQSAGTTVYYQITATDDDNGSTSSEVMSQVISTGTTEIRVTFVVTSLPDYTPPGDPIYIAGNFNEWNPGNAQYALSKNDDNRWEITLDGFTDGETIEFKFTRGSWDKVEVGAQGEEISNRGFTFNGDQTVQVTIHHWADGDTQPNQAPQIASVTTNPSSPAENQPFHVSATVTDSDGTVASVVLDWGLTSGSLNNPISMTNGSGDVYTTSAAIPAQSGGNIVYYQITATDEDNSSTSSAVMSQSIPTGIAGLFTSNKVSLYPNPAKSTLHIDVEGETNFTVTVFDIHGKKMNVDTNVGQKTVDVSSLANGMYMLRLVHQDNVVMKPFVKR